MVKLQKMDFFKPKTLKMIVICLVLLAILFFIFRLNKKEGFELSPEDVSSELNSGNKLALFYADWCGHCKKLKPTWDSAAETVNKDDDMKMVKINCGDGTPEQKEIMSKYNIDGYPTILIIKNGVATPYEGERTKSSFISTVEHMSD